MNKIIAKQNNLSLWAKHNVLEQINRYCFHLLCSFIDSFFNDHKKSRKSDLNFTLHVVPKYERLINLIVTTLIEEKIFEESNGYLYKTDKFKNFLKYQLDRKSAVFIKYKGIFELLDKCFDSYMDVLQGKQIAINLLFPDGNSEYIKGVLYHKTVTYSNDTVFPNMIANFMEDNKDIKHILEVGAGDGLLTWRLLERLKVYPNKYIFSDIGRSFLLDAKAKSKEMNYEFMRFEMIDLNRPILPLVEEKYDAIIAYNVVHATINVDRTFQYLSQALAPHGYVILIEIYQPYLWQHLTWGLLEGWWSYKDNYRVDKPTLFPNKWRQIMLSHNLKTISLFPEEEALNTNDTTLIIAKNMQS